MVSWRRPFARPESAYASGGLTASHSSLEYVEEKGGNDAPPNYQEASGAPVESVSPLGYAVGPVTIMFLNISMMIGTGIFSTRKCTRIEHMLLSTDHCSLGHLDWYRVCWTGIVLLGHWLRLIADISGRLPRICCLLSKSLWIGDGISGTSISATAIPCYDSIRSPKHLAIVQFQQLHR